MAACYKVFVTDATGDEVECGDGGCTTWTRQLLSNNKERLVIGAWGWSAYSPDLASSSEVVADKAPDRDTECPLLRGDSCGLQSGPTPRNDGEGTRCRPCYGAHNIP